MDSFGVYVKSNDEVSADEVSAYKATLHVNIWELPAKSRCIFRPAKSGCCVDFGLLIKNYKRLSSVMITIPFVIGLNDFEDLSHMLSGPELCNAIFNRVASVTIIKGQNLNGSSSYILKVPDVMPNGAILYPLTETNIVTRESSFSRIDLNLKTLTLQTEQAKLEDLYIRFRIKGETLEKQLLSPITKTNWFLESGFKKTEMIDFKINEIRNTDQAIIDYTRKEGFISASFQRVYFFIMEAATNGVDATGISAKCRKLENIWEKYINEPVSNMVAYQWEKYAKEEDGGPKAFQSYSQLTKVTYSGTNWKIIAVYLGAVLVLSILSNWFYDLIRN